MKIFISFSGEASQQAAIALHDWIRRVIHGVSPWMSHRDISAGSVWMEVLSANLRATHLGILCLTPENKQSPWMHFEAGAVWRNVDAAHVCPYLIGLEPHDLVGSLKEFQSHKADRQGTFKLLQAINMHPALQTSMQAEDLREAFDVWWPRLESRLAAIATSQKSTPTRRTVDEMVAETLDLVRRMAVVHPAPIPVKDTIAIDLRPLVGEAGAVWRAPFESFQCVQDLLDEIYFRLDGAVQPFTYGSMWLVMDVTSGKQFHKLGNGWATAHGLLRDERTLAEVGFAPGTRLEVLSVLDDRVDMLAGNS